MKVTLENFRKIQEYKKLGLSQKKTATNLSLTLTSVRKWWDATENDLLNAENTRAEYLDNYKEFMLSQLHTCPQIKVTNLLYRSLFLFIILPLTTIILNVYWLMIVYPSHCNVTL